MSRIFEGVQKIMCVRFWEGRGEMGTVLVPFLKGKGFFSGHYFMLEEKPPLMWLLRILFECQGFQCEKTNDTVFKCWLD